MVDNQDVAHHPFTIRTVVVGVDGSDESLSALRWAALSVEAGGTVHAVSAVAPAAVVTTAEVRYDPADLGGAIIERHLVEGDPAPALMQVARDVDADLIAVGVHAKPRLAPRTIGRVTARLVRETDRPLVIVENDADRTANATRTVAVDAGQGEATRASLRWASGYAAHRGMSLSLLRSIPSRPILGIDGLIDAMGFYIEPGILHEWAVEDLTALAEEIQESTDSELRISTSVSLGTPGRQLVEHSADADVLVVGRHSRSSLPVWLRHVITRAPCPVVIVPLTDSESEARWAS